MYFLTPVLLLFAVTGFCQNCGPKYNNQICAANACCKYCSSFRLRFQFIDSSTGSQYGWVSVQLP